MEFTWDEPKRRRNIEVHGLDFADAVVSFDFIKALVTPSYTSASGAARFKAVGKLSSETVTLIFSPLGTEAIALISLRPASPKERKAHDKRKEPKALP